MADHVIIVPDQKAKQHQIMLQPAIICPHEHYGEKADSTNADQSEAQIICSLTDQNKTVCPSNRLTGRFPDSPFLQTCTLDQQGVGPRYNDSLRSDSMSPTVG